MQAAWRSNVNHTDAVLGDGNAIIGRTNAIRALASDEGWPTVGEVLLAEIGGEQRVVFGQLIDGRCLASHEQAAVCTDVGHVGNSVYSHEITEVFLMSAGWDSDRKT